MKQVSLRQKRITELDRRTVLILDEETFSYALDTLNDIKHARKRKPMR
jgi:hypothetical protein